MALLYLTKLCKTHSKFPKALFKTTSPLCCCRAAHPRALRWFVQGAKAPAPCSPPGTFLPLFYSTQGKKKKKKERKEKKKTCLNHKAFPTATAFCRRIKITIKAVHNQNQIRQYPINIISVGACQLSHPVLPRAGCPHSSLLEIDGQGDMEGR